MLFNLRVNNQQKEGNIQNTLKHIQIFKTFFSAMTLSLYLPNSYKTIKPPQRKKRNLRNGIPCGKTDGKF